MARCRFGSYPLAEQSFQLSVRMPAPPPIDWRKAREEFQRTGSVRESDSSDDFPAHVVAGWFSVADRPVDHSAAAAAARRLADLWLQMKARVLLKRELASMAHPAREERGTAAALEIALQQIAEDAKRIAQNLTYITFEILMRRYENMPSAEIERLHEALHSSFHDGQWERHQVEHGETSPCASLLDKSEVGSRVTLAPTWLENACSYLALEAQLATIKVRKLPTQRVDQRSVTRAKRDLITGCAELWREATAEEPGARSDGNADNGLLAPFEKFLHQLWGHLAGLVLRRRSESPASKTADSYHEQMIRWLGLERPPSASKIHSLLRVDQSAPGRGDFSA